MDFQLDELTMAMRDEFRRVVDEVLIPNEKQTDETGEIPGAVLDALGKLGAFGLTIPERYGGLGLGMLETSVLIEQLGRSHTLYRCRVTNNIGLGPTSILLAGTDEQRERWLPRLASGEISMAFALSEPNAGSDSAALTTRAVRDGDDYVINGLKHFITNGDKADVVTVMAVTDPAAPPRSRVTGFLVQKGTQGMAVDRVQETMGPKGYAPVQMTFDDVRVSMDHRIGAEGDGLRLAHDTLSHGRLILAATCVGLAQRLLDESASYANIREQFGKPIGKNQAIQFMLADMATRVHAARLMVQHTGWLVDHQATTRKEAAMAKLYASEALGFVADSAVQIFGGMGYVTELPIERMYREARYFRIVEGTSEIQRMVIGREVLAEAAGRR